jgi:hypothetical protein
MVALSHVIEQSHMVVLSHVIEQSPMVVLSHMIDKHACDCSEQSHAIFTSW